MFLANAAAAAYTPPQSSLVVPSVEGIESATPPGGLLTAVASAAPPMPADQCGAAVSISDDRRLVVVAHGFDNKYYASWQSAAGFPAWTPLAGFAFASGPALTQDARGDVVVFGRTPQGRIEYATLHPNGGIAPGWADLGGAITGRPAPILDSRGLLHVFAQSSTDHAVLYKGQHVNGSRAEWGSWEVLDGAVSSAPQPMLDAEGWLHVFARGLDRSLWHKQQVPSDASSTGWEWCVWAPLGPGLPLPSLPRIPRLLNAQNFVELLVRGPDRALWHKRQALANASTVGWSAWRRLGGVLAGAPATARASDGLLFVFVRGPEGRIYLTQQAHHPTAAGQDAWTSWSALAGEQVHSAAPEAALDGNGLMHLFSRAADGAMLHMSQAAVLGGTNASCADFPSPWASLGGRFRSFEC